MHEHAGGHWWQKPESCVRALAMPASRVSPSDPADLPVRPQFGRIPAVSADDVLSNTLDRALVLKGTPATRYQPQRGNKLRQSRCVQRNSSPAPQGIPRHAAFRSGTSNKRNSCHTLSLARDKSGRSVPVTRRSGDGARRPSSWHSRRLRQRRRLGCDSVCDSFL